jgi:hypothetical protein
VSNVEGFPTFGETFSCHLAPSKVITPDMVTVRFAEMLENAQCLTWPSPKS